MVDLRHLELLDEDRQYLNDQWENIRHFQSSVLQSVDVDSVYLHSVFSWLEIDSVKEAEGISAQVLEYYANNSNELVLATYANRQAVVTLDIITSQVNSASFVDQSTGMVERIEHFVNQNLEKFYQASDLFDHYRALILEQNDKAAYFFQMMKALMALDKKLIINNDPSNDQFWNLQCLALYEQYVLQKKVSLLTKEEKITKILERAGWYKGRQINLEEFERYCKEEKIILFPAAKRFLQEYNGLVLSYSIYYRGGYDTARRVNYLYDYADTANAAKRKYLLMPTLNLTSPHISDFNRILIFSEESCVALGEFGYYHSLLAIGQSGTFYLVHEFSEEIEVFDDLPAVLAWDMEQTKLVSDTLLLANKDKVLRLNQVQSNMFGYACMDLIGSLLKYCDHPEYQTLFIQAADKLRHNEVLDLSAYQTLADGDDEESRNLYQCMTLLRQLFTNSGEYFMMTSALYELLKTWHTHKGTAWVKEYEEAIHTFLVSILYQKGYRLQKDLLARLEQYDKGLWKIVQQ